jgi:hypothetical protein
VVLWCHNNFVVRCDTKLWSQGLLDRISMEESEQSRWKQRMD